MDIKLSTFDLIRIIAVFRHQKKWDNDKSKEPKNRERAMHNWLRSSYYRESFINVFAECLALSYKPTVDIDKNSLRLRWTAEWLLEREVSDRRGRPTKLKPGGLLAQFVKKKRPVSGRPASLSLVDEKRWVCRLQGVELRLLARKELGQRVFSIDETITILGVGNPNFDKELAAHTRAALQDPAMNGFNPNARNLDALLKRARRAKALFGKPSKLLLAGG